jgi:NADPH-dependent curcumin reductase CurA
MKPRIEIKKMMCASKYVTLPFNKNKTSNGKTVSTLVKSNNEKFKIHSLGFSTMLFAQIIHCPKSGFDHQYSKSKNLTVNMNAAVTITTVLVESVFE